MLIRALYYFISQIMIGQSVILIGFIQFANISQDKNWSAIVKVPKLKTGFSSDST